MKIRLIVLSAGVAAALMTTATYADQADKNKEFCHALERFSVDLSKLGAVTPASTIQELRSAADKLANDANKVVKTSGKIKSTTAKQFTESAKQLRSDANKLPDNLTIEQAKTRLDDDINNVNMSAQKLAEEAGCPAATP